MRNISLIGFVISLFLVTPAFSHLCHDPFRPRERLVLIPEKDLIKIEEEGEFRIYVENTFHSTLRDVQLFIESPAFNIEIEPKVLKRLVPGERAFFLVKLKLKKGFTPGSYPLKMSVSAKSAELKPSVEKIDVVVDKKVPKPKVKPRRIKPEVKKPEVKKENIQEKRILLDEELGLPIEDVSINEMSFSEEIKKEKQEVQNEGLEVSSIEEDIGLIDVEPEVEAQEMKETEEGFGEVVVEVEEKPFWKKPYFYIVPILLLLGILIWRKIKR